MFPRFFAMMVMTVLALFARPVDAQTYTYHVYIDSDLRTSTGCTISAAGQSFVGADYRLTATVSGTPPRVTARTLAPCSGGTFGAGSALSANYPVGLNNGLPLPGGAFADVIELSVTRSMLTGAQAQMRFGIGSVSASGSVDVLYTQNGQVGGPALIVGSPALIPTLGFFGALLMAMALVVVALRTLKRNRGLAQMLLVAAFLSVGLAAWAANFVADGLVGDWASTPPKGMDALGDAVPDLAGSDLVGTFAAEENLSFFFRVDVVDVENQPPVAVNDSYTTLEDTALNVAAPGVLSNDSDADGNPISAQLLSGPTQGTLTLNANGSFSYTPNANANGTDSFTYNAFDGQVPSATPATVSITITPVNDVPVFTAGANQSVNEDAGAQTVNPWALGINDGDPEVIQVLSFTVLSNSNPALFSVAPAISATGVLTYTPAADASGSATLSVQLSDNGGTANSGVDTSAAQSFTITVNTVNDAPTLTASNPPTVLEDAAPVSIANWASFNPGPPDEASQTLLGYQISAISNPALFAAAPALANDGTLSYTVAANANGSSTFVARAQDSGGTANGGIDLSAVQTFTINVTAVNDAPSFTVGADQTVNEDAGPQTVNAWLSTFSDGDPEVIQALSFVITNNSNPALFSSAPSVSPVGTLSYTPAANANGSAIITLRIVDDGSNTPPNVNQSATQTFTINVSAVNDAPSFVAGANQTVDEDVAAQTVTPWATAISPGPADEAAQTVAFTISNNSNPGLFSALPAVSPTGVLTYTPAANANGSATLTLILTDSGSNTPPNVNVSAPQTFTITVSAVNDAPINTVPPIQTTPDTVPLVFNTANLNAISLSDIDAAAGIVQMSFGTGAPANGTLTLANPGGVLTSLTGNGSALVTATGTITALNLALNGPSGSLTYTPVAGTTATRTITVISNDQGNTGSGGALSDTDTIDVNADAAPDVSLNVSGTVANNVTLTLTFTEAVNVSGLPGVTLLCGGVGIVPLTNTTGSNITTLTLGYTAPLPPGSCVLSVPVGNVSDVDAIDPPDIMNGSGSRNFAFTVDEAPALLSSTPAALAVVNTAQTVTFTYNEPVNDLGSAITLNCAGPIAGTISGSGTATLTFTPTNPLPAGASCLATAVATQINDADSFDPPANPIGNSTINFNVDAAPAFVSSVPAANGAIVGTGQVLSFTFDENVANLGTAITLNCGSNVAGSITGGGTTTLTFTPSAALTAGASCTATAVALQIGDSDAIDPPQNPIADVVRTFTVDVAPTVTASNPAEGAIDVPLAGVVSFTFSENVDFAAVNFSYLCNGNPVAFNVAGGGTNTATLTPSANLPINSPCTVTALTTIVDSDSADPPNDLSAAFPLNFTSVNDNAPTVQSVSPANNAVSGSGPTITLIFSETVDIGANAITVLCLPSNATLVGPLASATTGNFGLSGSPATTGQPGDTCTVTVESTLVTDADAIDPPNQLDGNNSGDTVDGDADDFVSTYTIDSPPSLLSSTPAELALVNTLQTVSFTYNEPVNDLGNAITLNCAGPIVGTISGSGTATLTFVPTNPLPAGASCLATAVATQIDDADGFDPPLNPLSNSTINFNVDAAPAFVSSIPAADGAIVGTGQIVSFSFDENVANLGTAITLDCGGNVTGSITGGGTTTLTFTPSGPLTAGASCTATAVALQIGDSDTIDPPQNPVANVVRTFTVDEAPTVTGSNPANNAINVGIANNLTVNFSEAVTFSPSAFTLECPATAPIAFTVSGSGTSTATIDPMPATLPINTLCVLTVDAAQITDVDSADPPDTGAGITTIMFTTVNDNPPSVLSAEVEIGNVFTALPLGVGQASDSNTQIRLTFNEPVAPSGLWAQVLCTISGSRTVLSGLAVADADPVFVLTPSVNLSAGDSCTLTVFANQVFDDDAIDPPDTMTANFVTSFNVDAAPAVSTVLPANTASNVATDSTITVNFTEPVNVAAGGVTLNCGAAVSFGAGLPATNVSSLVLTPTVALPEGATCNGSVVAASVTDVDLADPPQTMAAAFTWSFTTDAAPTVTSINVANGAVVPTTQTFVVNFSENVDLTLVPIDIDCGGGIPYTGSPSLPATATSTVTITPFGGLPAGASCTFTVQAGQVTDSDSNDPPNNMAANVVRNFTVDAAPTVLSTTPATGATNVNPTSPISIDFSESMTFDTTANAVNTSFDLECPLGSPVDFSVTSASPNDPVVLNPLDSAIAGRSCTLTVRSGAPSNLQDADAIDPPNNLAADFTATIDFGAIANDDAYTVTPHLTLAIGAGSPQGGGAAGNDILGAGTITGFGFAPTCTGAAPGAQLDAGAANGRFTLNADGSFAYEPPAGLNAITRTFCYTVTGGDTANIVFTVENQARVWFVDAAAAASGDGTQARPFNALTGAGSFDTVAADGNGDTIYIEGAQTGGLTLRAGQRVIGGGSTASIATFSGVGPIAGSAFPAVSGTPPVITCSNVTCLALNGSGVLNTHSLRGFTIGDTGATGTDIGGTTFGTLTVAELTLTGSGTTLNLTTGTLNGTFLDLNANAGSGSLTLSAVGGTWSVQNQVDITGVLIGAFSIANMPAGGSVTLTGGMNSSGGNGSISLTNNASPIYLGNVLLNTTTSMTVSGSTGVTTVTGGSLTTPVNTLLVTNSAVDITLSTLTSSGGAPGPNLSATNFTGSINIASGNISNSQAGNTAVVLSNNAGTFSFGGQVAKNTAGRAIDISGGTGNVTFSGIVSCFTSCGTGAGNEGLRVTGRTGGTVAFSGGTKTFLSSATNPAIALTSNTGGTINFTGGGLAITTTSGTGFTATGGGTVTVQGAGNTVSTTTGTAVNINATTIGGGGMTFESINSTAASANTAIVLNNTGAGAFSVTGTGAAGSGGTIDNKTVDAVQLNTTGGLVSLDRMIIEDIGDMAGGFDVRSGHDAIQGLAVDGGLSLTGTTIRRISDQAIHGGDHLNPAASTVWDGLVLSGVLIEDTNRFHVTSRGDANNEGSVRIVGLRGTVNVTNSTFRRGAEFLDMFVTAGTLNMTVTGSSFTNAYKEFTAGDLSPIASVGNHCVDVVVQDAANANVTIGDRSVGAAGNSFLNCRVGSIRVVNDTGSTGSSDVIIARNSFVSNDGTSGVFCNPTCQSAAYDFPQGGVLAQHLGSGSVDTVFENNTLTDVSNASGGVGQLTLIAEAGLHQALVQNNTFTRPGNAPWEVRSRNSAAANLVARFVGNAVVKGQSLCIDNPVCEDGIGAPGYPAPGLRTLLTASGGATLAVTLDNNQLDGHDQSFDAGETLEIQSDAGTVCANLSNNRVEDGYSLEEPSGTMSIVGSGTCSTLGAGSPDCTALLGARGNRGGSNNVNLNPPFVRLVGNPLTVTAAACAVPTGGPF